MIRPDISPVAVREQLRRTGRVQIEDYIEPAGAERLRECLSHEVPWSLSLCDAQGPRVMLPDAYAALGPAQRQDLYRQVAADGPPGGYRFAYDSYMMTRAYDEGRDPGLLLHPLLEFLNSPQYLVFMRALTGEPRVVRIDAQATAYRPGQFLREHTDEHRGTGRLFAYVLNLTRHWRADWGGLLSFIDDYGNSVETFMPRWNSLSLFRVPVRHAVSMVMPWAEGERLAITGWLLSTASADDEVRS